jgi:spermidine/putrescine transport system substrate-binding protein
MMLVIVSLAAMSFASCKDKNNDGQDNERFSQLDDTGQLNILAPENYIPSEIRFQFEINYGIETTIDTFSRDSEMTAKMTNGVTRYDLILCGAEHISDMRESGGVLREIETSRLTNYANINPVYQSRYYDPQNEYSVPYAAGCSLLAYNAEIEPFAPENYNALMRDDLKSAVTLPNEMRDVIGAALLASGASVNAADEQSVSKVRSALNAIKPNVISFNSVNPYEALLSGTARVGLMRNYHIYKAMETSPSAMYVYPTEGVALWIDCLAITENAANLSSAYYFLDFVLDAKTSARISSSIGRTNCNTAAREFLPDYYVKNQAICIPDDIAEKAEMYESWGDAERIYAEIWEEFKLF